MPIPVLDERTESSLLILPTPHRLPVDARRERGVRLAHLVHDDSRILAERVEDAGERVPQRVRRVRCGSRASPRFACATVAQLGSFKTTLIPVQQAATQTSSGCVNRATASETG
jgi:hypothetical protein